MFQQIFAAQVERDVIDAGFFSNIKDKIINSSDVTQGIDVEVGKTQVAVNLNIIVEYGKHLPTIFENIKEVIQKEVLRMTELELIEVNVKVGIKIVFIPTLCVWMIRRSIFTLLSEKSNTVAKILPACAIKRQVMHVS